MAALRTGIEISVALYRYDRGELELTEMQAEAEIDRAFYDGDRLMQMPAVSREGLTVKAFYTSLVVNGPSGTHPVLTTTGCRNQKLSRTLVLATVGAALLSAPVAAEADDILYISDSNDNIGQLDLTTQQVAAGIVHNTGQTLTDIGFNSTGTFFGTTFTGLYSINPATGAATSIGTYGAAADAGMNALLGNGTNLLGASFTTNTISTSTA